MLICIIRGKSPKLSSIRIVNATKELSQLYEVEVGKIQTAFRLL